MPHAIATVRATQLTPQAAAGGAVVPIFVHHYVQQGVAQMFLKQSTASQEILLGPFVDDADGKTAETGLTIANTDIKVFKGGATTLANKNSGGGTHISSGNYSAVLDATDTDTVGNLEIIVQVSGALAVRRQYAVLEEAVYDAIVAAAAPGYLQPTVATRTLDVSVGGEAGVDWANIGSPTTAQNLSATNIDADQIVASVSGAVGSVTGTVGSVTGAVGSVTGAVGSVTGTVGSVTGNVGGNVVGSVASVATGGITAGSIAADAIGAAELAADAVAEIADAVWDEAIAGHVGIGSTGESLNSAGGASDPWITALPGAYGAGTAGNIVGNNLNAAISSRLASAGYTAPDNATITAIAALIDTEIAAILAAVDTEVGAIKTVTDALPNAGALTTIQSDLDDIQTRVPAALVSGRIDASVGALAANVVTAASMAVDAGAEIADAVWDEALAGHAIGGSAGAALTGAGSAGDPWTSSLPGAYGVGTAGKIVGDNLNATISSRASQTSVDTVDDLLDTEVGAIKTDTAAIKLKTDNLPTDPADDSDLDAAIASLASTLTTISGLLDTEIAVILAAVDTEVGAIKTVTDALPNAGALTTIQSDLDNIQTRIPTTLVSGRIDSSVGAMDANVLTASALAADAVDEILDDTIGDGTITVRQALRVLIAGMAGKLSGAATTTVTIRNTADSANVIVATVTADGDRTAVVVTP